MVANSPVVAGPSVKARSLEARRLEIGGFMRNILRWSLTQGPKCIALLLGCAMTLQGAVPARMALSRFQTGVVRSRH